jgi:hypothetical protein
MGAIGKLDYNIDHSREQGDPGGPQAPNAPKSSLPGVVVGAFVDDGECGHLLGASQFAGMSLQKAVRKAETL